jgi:hypothetical protein
MKLGVGKSQVVDFQRLEIGGKLAQTGGIKNGSTGEIGASGSFSRGSDWCNLLALSLIVCHRIKPGGLGFSILAEIRPGRGARGGVVAGSAGGRGGVVLVVAWCLSSAPAGGMVRGMSAVGEITKHGKTPEVREARRLFLFGGPDGVRVLKVERLAEMSGAHVQTVRRHLAAWEAEAEAMLAQSSENGFRLKLNAETLAKHEKDVMFLRKSLDSMLLEASALPDLLGSLRDVVQRFLSSGDKDAYEVAADAFARYLKTFGTRESLNSQILALQKRWKECAGIESLQSVAETREKTLASGRAKLRLRAEEAQGMAGPDGARAIGSGGSAGGVFAKRVQTPAVDVVGNDEV